MKKTICQINRMILILVVCIFVIAVGGINALAAQNGSVPGDASALSGVEKVPLTIKLSYPIAGAEFKLNHTEGLTLQAFEKSEETNSALITPIVEKDGNIHVGFFAEDNNYAPQGGELLVGYLVFEYDGTPSQSVTITETKLVQIIDKDNTESEILTNSITIGVPNDGNTAIGTGNNTIIILLLIIAVVVVVAICIFVIYRKKMSAKPKP